MKMFVLMTYLVATGPGGLDSGVAHSIKFIPPAKNAETICEQLGEEHERAGRISGKHITASYRCEAVDIDADSEADQVQLMTYLSTIGPNNLTSGVAFETTDLPLSSNAGEVCDQIGKAHNKTGNLAGKHVTSSYRCPSIRLEDPDS